MLEQSADTLLATHEIGHLFGNFDECVSSVVNPDDPSVRNVYDSLLGLGVADPVYERYFQFVLGWLSGFEQLYTQAGFFAGFCQSIGSTRTCFRRGLAL